MPTIEQLRQKIERIDVSIIAKLAERKKLSQQIGKLKLQEGKDIIDLSQEKKIFENYESLTEQYRLPQPFIKRLFKIIIAYSRKVQK